MEVGASMKISAIALMVAVLGTSVLSAAERTYVDGDGFTCGCYQPPDHPNDVIAAAKRKVAEHNLGDVKYTQVDGRRTYAIVDVLGNYGFQRFYYTGHSDRLYRMAYK